ncbi:hypothetical protein H257_17667 [Aphanomyces astaci]|uniref:Uncharacterized protein n=1 Tax=Aphanomyces astaci TaxID=112090 RepID=W4FDV4_APHAT|nr:hypothetical protein H257_17667 [Aphanomyces astaci]ETV65672.1 hypothetical protein H257_17667 [Aphanomyces astaci]|eukprot:XP_009844836.1 hypothetical protein H257_17667 [Aphanomyces astaci]
MCTVHWLARVLVVASYSLSICVFGYLSLRQHPFLLIAAGLFIWIVAQSLARPPRQFSPSPRPAPEANALAGLGAPFRPARPLGARWGPSLPKVWGDVGFYILGGAVVPLAYLSFRWIPSGPCVGYDPSTATAEMLMPCLNNRNTNIINVTADVDHQHTAIVSTLISEAMVILSTLMFLTSSIGFAVYVFTLADGGVRARHSHRHGRVGRAIDCRVHCQCRGRGNAADYQLFIATRQMFWLVAVGTSMAFLSWMLLYVPVACLGCLFLSLLLLFMTQSSQSVSILRRVIDPQGRESLNLQCVVDGKDGLQRVLAFAILWLG